MKLTFEQIKSVTQGALRVFEENGRIKLMRFTEEQQELYSTIDKGFHLKTFASAGIRLEFLTDSQSLGIKLYTYRASSRFFLAYDIVIDSKQCYCLSAQTTNDGDRPMTLCGSYTLGEGEKRICIYMPWSYATEIVSIELDDGASVIPVERPRKMLMFGDSITHGYDASHPSASYASRLADALGFEAVNKGIGGECLRPALAALNDGFTPDIITVAYGTNDWKCHDSREEFDRKCESFYKNLREQYPSSKIFALAPIWRGNCDIITNVGEFEYIAKKTKSVAEALPDVTFINCFDFVPPCPRDVLSRPSAPKRQWL